MVDRLIEDIVRQFRPNPRGFEWDAVDDNEAAENLEQLRSNSTYQRDIRSRRPRYDFDEQIVPVGDHYVHHHVPLNYVNLRRYEDRGPNYGKRDQMHIYGKGLTKAVGTVEAGFHCFEQWVDYGAMDAEASPGLIGFTASPLWTQSNGLLRFGGVFNVNASYNYCDEFKADFGLELLTPKADTAVATTETLYADKFKYMAVAGLEWHLVPLGFAKNEWYLSIPTGTDYSTFIPGFYYNIAHNANVALETGNENGWQQLYANHRQEHMVYGTSEIPRNLIFQSGPPICLGKADQLGVDVGENGKLVWLDTATSSFEKTRYRGVRISAQILPGYTSSAGVYHFFKLLCKVKLYCKQLK